MVNSDDEKFVVAFVTNVILCVAFLALFVIFRRFVPKIYQPRCDGSPTAPPEPPSTLFGWVLSTARYSEEQLYVTHGMDALMFVKFEKMMMYICSLISLYGFVVLFAVNATGENTKLPSSDEFHVSGLNSLTMASISSDSTRLLAHLFSIIFNSAVVYFFTYRMYRMYMHLRLKYKASPELIENFSVMVREVPVAIDDQHLRNFFESLFPGKVISVIRSYSTPKLIDKINEREAEKRGVEKSYAIHQITGARPTHKEKIVIGKVVDSIDWHTTRFNKLTDEIGNLQGRPAPRASVVFVVFTDILAASQCSQLMLNSENKCVAEPAPEPRDLVWQHFNINHHQFMIRKLLANIFFFFLIFFWVIPVTFVSGLSNLDTLSEIPAFSFLVDFIELSPVVTGFVQGFLPTLALLIFFALLVKIITAAVTLTGVYTKSKISRTVMSKYFAFQVFNVLLVYAIAGSIFNTLYKLIDNPTSVIDILATSLPQQGTFFINYVMLLSLSGHTKNLWRPGPLIVRWIKHRFLSKTLREYKEAEAPGTFSYAEAYTTDLLVFTILLTYSTMAPFIMIFGVLYFSMAYMSNKYNIVYVNIPEWEGGGKHWHEVFNRICAGTFLYQLVLVGVFSVYKFFAATVISAICAAATLVYCWYTNTQFYRSSYYLPARHAAHLSPLLSNAGYEEIPPLDSKAGIALDHRIDIASQDPANIAQAASAGIVGSPGLTKEKTRLNNLNHHLFYHQPSLAPLVDQPELIVSPSKSAQADHGERARVDLEEELPRSESEEMRKPLGGQPS